MKPDSMLTHPEWIIEAGQQVTNLGAGNSLEGLGKHEPALACYINEAAAGIAGKLSLSGAPTPVVQGLHEDMLAIIMTSIQALRRGHYELWKDTIVGSRLVELDDSLQAAPCKPRRKKKNSTDPGE